MVRIGEVLGVGKIIAGFFKPNASSVLILTIQSCFYLDEIQFLSDWLRLGGRYRAFPQHNYAIEDDSMLDFFEPSTLTRMVVGIV
jgi:hypothetical protein